MTYGELRKLKTNGWFTNHAIDDEVSNARFCRIKDSEIVPEHVTEKITNAAFRDGIDKLALIMGGQA